MTEKRFFILTDDEYDDTRPCIRDRTFKINDIYGDYKYDDLNEICNELNRLNDENEQLKSELSEKDIQLDFLKDENKHMRDLVNENEQLKQREKTLEGMIRTFDEGCKEIYDDKCRLEEENEQLKHDASVLVQSNKDYRIDNEQLKESLLSTSKELQYGVKKVQRLAKENEELKQQLKTKVIVNKQYEESKRLEKENEQLKHNNKMLSMKMSEVSTKYRLLKEFSEDTNPNEAVKTVLHELMMITKEYR